MKLIPQADAPRCSACGTPLWKFTTYSDAGIRLGYVTTHREVDGKPICWNGKACEKRCRVNADEWQRVIDCLKE